MLIPLNAVVAFQALSACALVLPQPQAPLASPAISTSDDTTSRIPTIPESAQLARQILRNESIATLSTVFPPSQHSRDASTSTPNIAQRGDDNSELSKFENRPPGLGGMPIGLMDYYADCEDDGNPTILAISIATSFRNTAAGSNVSMSVRQRPSSESAATPEFPSPAAHARFSLLGHIEAISEHEVEDKGIKQCFLDKHPDAVAWLPGNRIHKSWWARLVVEEVYWIGGFGDRAFIGWIPREVWRDAGIESGQMS